MPLFMVERYLAQNEIAALTDQSAALHRLTSHLERVTYRWCLLAAGDATAFCLIEAPDAATVADLNRQCGFAFDRITPVVLIDGRPMAQR